MATNSPLAAKGDWPVFAGTTTTEAVPAFAAFGRLGGDATAPTPWIWFIRSKALAFENHRSREYPEGMSVNWLKVAQKMAEDAREQLAINRRRLQEIIEKRDRQQPKQQLPTNAQ